MFHVTVVNLTRDTRHAEISDARSLGNIPTDELLALLETFAQIDAGENANAEPEIRVEAGRKRFVIRTVQKKLFLYNARDLSEPAYEVTPREVIEELDGTADTRRKLAAPESTPVLEPSADPTSSSFQAPLEFAPRPEVPPPSPPYLLMALVLMLGLYIGYAEWRVPAREKPPEISWLAGTELATEDSQLSGAYMTGTEPGQHGIVIVGGGKMELFQVNTRGGPSTVYGTYQLGRNKDALQLATDQPGGMITVLSPNSLEFCGETYARIGKR